MNAILMTSVAALTVGLQIVCLPILSILFGDLDNHEAYIVASLFLGMTFGMIPFQRKKYGKLFSLFFFVGFFSLWVKFDSIQMLALNYTPLRWSVLVFFFLSIIWAGRLLLESIYIANSFSKQYSHLNLFNFFILSIWIIFLPRLGLDYSLLVLSISVLFAFWSINELAQIKRQSTSQKVAITFEPRFLKKNIETVNAGIASSFFLSLYFDVLSIFVYPLDLKMPFYLIGTFLFLWKSVKIQSVLEKLKVRSVTSVVFIGYFTMILSYLFVFGGSHSGFFLNFVDIKYYLFRTKSSYYSIVLPLVSVLFLPYVFFSTLVPFQEKMNKGQNNLFFCTLGNLVGFVFFLLFLQDLSINVKLICATGWTVFSSFVSKGWYLRFFSSMLFIFSFFPFGLSDLDKRIVSRGLYIFRSGQNPEYLSNSSNEQENQLTRFDSFHRKMGQLGYLENPKLAPRKYLGLNGYQDQILKPNDILRSVVVADLLENDTKKILILGMGNQLLLTRIKSLIYRSQRKDLQIDLVDNFPPFLDIEFLNAIAREGGFQWPQDQFNFIYADALNFLSRVEPESYDMIVWNLTSPNFGTSAKIFTRQMSQLVARAIRSKGIYLTKTFGNLSLDCSLVDGFQQSFHYPLNSCRSTSFQLAYGKKNQPDSLGNAPILEASFTKLFFSPLLNTSSSLECSSVPKLTLANSNMRPILKKLGTITRDRECYTSKIPDWDFGDNLNRSTRLALTLEKAAIPIVFSLPIDLPNQDMEKRLTRSTELWMEMTGTTKFLPLYLSEYSSHYFAISQLNSLLATYKVGIFYKPHAEEWKESLSRFRSTQINLDQVLYSLHENDSSSHVFSKSVEQNTLHYDSFLDSELRNLPYGKKLSNTCHFIDRYKERYGEIPTSMDIKNYNLLLLASNKFLAQEEADSMKKMVLLDNLVSLQICQQSGASRLFPTRDDL